MIKLKNLLNEGFSKKEEKKIADTVKKVFDDKGNNGVRDYDTLNRYLGKLNFEIDAADIKIGDWESQHSNRQRKAARIILQGKTIGQLDFFG